MPEPREARLRTKLTREIYRHEEKIGLVRIQGFDRAAQKNFVNGNFRSKQMIGTAFINQPILVELLRQVVDINSNSVGEVQRIERGRDIS